MTKSGNHLSLQKKHLLHRIIPSKRSSTLVTRDTLSTFLATKRKVASDYLILLDILGVYPDIQHLFEIIHARVVPRTRIVITSYNFVWEPMFALFEKAGFRSPAPLQNWLSLADTTNLLALADLEVIKKGTDILMPFHIPLVTRLVNRYIARLPLIKELCLVQYCIVRKRPNGTPPDFSVSVIVPARNEAGTIEELVTHIPKLGSKTELIFVEGGSTDATRAEIRRVMNKYKDRAVRLLTQGKTIGKGDAVHRGFAKAHGDILMILDADLSVSPAVLIHFYRAICSGKGEFINGSRLVYPVEKQAMRFLNILGNKFFSMAFTWLLDQPLKDTLCGTKVLFKKDYQEIARSRSYFGNFDPFGDFDLLFGASRLHLKIIEIPVRYHARTYGTTNISRFRHGWLLLKMTIFAARKLKFV